MASGPITGGAPGSRGGFSNVVTTVNTMKDPQEQFSLSECLRLGVFGAHRNLQCGTSETRNFRRSGPMGQLELVGPTRRTVINGVVAHAASSRDSNGNG